MFNQESGSNFARLSYSALSIFRTPEFSVSVGSKKTEQSVNVFLTFTVLEMDKRLIREIGKRRKLKKKTFSGVIIQITVDFN